MTDEELLERLESGTLQGASFRHLEHVQLTWVCLARYGREETERRLLEGLRALAVREGRPGKFDAALTRAWIRTIDQARAGDASATTFQAFAARRPDLLSSRSPAAAGRTI
jgi:hypothetical protein